MVVNWKLQAGLLALNVAHWIGSRVPFEVTLLRLGGIQVGERRCAEAGTRGGTYQHLLDGLPPQRALRVHGAADILIVVVTYGGIRLQTLGHECGEFHERRFHVAGGILGQLVATLTTHVAGLDHRRRVELESLTPHFGPGGRTERSIRRREQIAADPAIQARDGGLRLEVLAHEGIGVRLRERVRVRGRAERVDDATVQQGHDLGIQREAVLQVFASPSPGCTGTRSRNPNRRCLP